MPLIARCSNIKKGGKLTLINVLACLLYSIWRNSVNLTGLWGRSCHCGGAGGLLAVQESPGMGQAGSSTMAVAFNTGKTAKEPGVETYLAWVILTSAMETPWKRCGHRRNESHSDRICLDTYQDFRFPERNSLPLQVQRCDITSG